MLSRPGERAYRIVGLLAALSVAVTSGCATNPVTGRPELALVSAEREKELGRDAAQRVEQEMGLLDDPALVAYVQAVGQRLAAQSPRRDVQYQFQVVDRAEPNAFALPGGHVYVTRGLLVFVNSEDELAGVIGHEIGHVAARHSVQQISRAAPLAVVTGISAAVTGVVSPGLGRMVGGAGAAASELILAPYNRDQEREADRVGQELAAASGWDPAGLPAFLKTLGREEDLTGGGPRRTSFLDSHPATPERVAATAEHASALRRAPADPIRSDRTAFLRRLDGLPVGARAAEGVFDGQRFLHPDLDFTVRFPDRWSTENNREQVAAVAPDQQAFMALEVVAKGGDPLIGAKIVEKASRAPVLQTTERLTISGLPAARTRLRGRTETREVTALLVWIAYKGRIYQIVGVTPLERAEAFAPVFESTMRSFRPLTQQERGSIREDRLRLVEAREGENVSALAARSGTRWSAAMVAVANGLAPDDRLRRGQLVKVARSEPYTAPAR
jgi:predicted Zn-dependent protease